MSDQSMDRSQVKIHFSWIIYSFWLSLVGADNSLNSSDGFVEDEDDCPPGKGKAEAE